MLSPMPWTFAHPAAILPLRRRLPLAALVVGSLSPDFGYYLGLFPLARFAHTLPGLLLVCLPLAALCLVLVHALRSAVVDLMPQPHRAALRGLLPRAADAPTVRRMGTALLGLLAGASTHLVWDSFTHVNGLSVHWIPVLHDTVFHIAGRATPLYNLLQHLSTLIGAALLAGAYACWLRGQPDSPLQPEPAGERARWALLLGCLALAGVGGALVSRLEGFTGEGFVVHAAFHAGTLLALLLVGAALWWRMHRRAACAREYG